MIRVRPHTLVGWIGALLSVAGLAAASGDLRLVEAVKNRDQKTARALLAQKIDVRARQGDGTTALHWAAQWDDLDTGALLIRAGADVNAANDYGLTPLSLACTNGSAAMVGQLLRAGANPNAALSTGETPLMTAARTGTLDVVNALLGGGADVHAKEHSLEQTALMWAAAEGHIEVVRTLIEHGADANAPSKSGFTPLMFAVRSGDLATARSLVAAGANVNDVDRDGNTPLLIATVRSKTTELATFLLEHGADPNVDLAGYTVLHWAAGNWETSLTGPFGMTAESTEWHPYAGLRGPAKLDYVKRLLAHGADPNARITRSPSRFGYSAPLFQHRTDVAGDGVFAVTLESLLVGATPFVVAALAGDTSTMRLLVEAGADPLVAAKANWTPLMAAAGIGRFPAQTRVTESSALEAVKMTLELGGDVHAANEHGDTALFGAAYMGYTSIARYLIERGATVNVTNKRGYTPLMVTQGQGPRLAATNLDYPELAKLFARTGR